MSKFNIAVTASEDDPKQLKAIISWEFAIKLDDAEKLMKKIRESDIINTLSKTIVAAFGEDHE